MKHETASSVTPAGGGANITGSRAPYHLPCDSNSGGGAAVASPPVPDEMPGSAGADEIGLEEIFAYDLVARDLEDDSDPQAFPRSRRLICSASSDGQTTIHRFGDGGGLVLTAEETRQAYEFLSATANIWKKAPHIKPAPDSDASIFELCFLDGTKRTVQAFNFSSAKVIAAYERQHEEGCVMHSQLTIDDKRSRIIGKALA